MPKITSTKFLAYDNDSTNTSVQLRKATVGDVETFLLIVSDSHITVFSTETVDEEAIDALEAHCADAITVPAFMLDHESSY